MTHFDFSRLIVSVYKYLSRTDFDDHIIYTYSLKQSLNQFWMDSSAYSISFDTLTQEIWTNSEFDKLIGEPVIEESQLYYYLIGSMGNLRTKTKPSIADVYYNYDTCWQKIIADDCFAENQYVDGLGGPYYQCDNFMSLGGQKRELVYYKKGNETWGSPLIITEVEKFRTSNEISIYPNPAKDNLHIVFTELNLDYTLQIFDINGRVVLENSLQAKESLISTAILNPGIYYLRVFNGNQILKNEKIIILK
jgi:hypothetical protein